ncbi:MAG: segregation and condensation protein A [Lachnospirales bacterium]
MKLEFKLGTFEGPLDLLHHLIEKNKIDIMDIPIALITDQYLEYINQYKNIEHISEFIVMASTLLEIKSKMLLPIVLKESDVEDPRDELVEKLVEYKRAKIFAESLKDKFINNTIVKSGEMDIIKIFNTTYIDPHELLKNVPMSRLYKIFKEVMERKANRVDGVRMGFSKVERDEYTIENKRDTINALLLRHGQIAFREIFEDTRNKNEMVVSFLTILEMIKCREIKVMQEESFAEIYIERMTP